MRLEGEVPTGYRGAADHGRDWLERGHYPRLRGPGFVVVLVLGLAALNGCVVLYPVGAVYLAACAGAAGAAVLAATPLRRTGDEGALVPAGSSAAALLAWAAWLAIDFANTGIWHRHLVLALAALAIAMAWHGRRKRYAWWTVIPTSDAWNEEAISAYAEFLVAGGRGPYAEVVARELFRIAADLALKPAAPSPRQLAAMHRYVEALRDGVGGFPDFREARWWKDKVNEFEGRAERERLHRRANED